MQRIRIPSCSPSVLQCSSADGTLYSYVTISSIATPTCIQRTSSPPFPHVRQLLHRHPTREAVSRPYWTQPRLDIRQCRNLSSSNIHPLKLPRPPITRSSVNGLPIHPKQVSLQHSKHYLVPRHPTKNKNKN